MPHSIRDGEVNGMAKNKNNANPKATRFNAEVAEEIGAKNNNKKIANTGAVTQENNK